MEHGEQRQRVLGKLVSDKKQQKVPENATNHIEASRRNEDYRKVRIKEEEIDHDVEVPQESNEYETDQENMSIKIVKIKSISDEIPQTCVEHYQPVQSIKHETIESVKSEPRADLLLHISQINLSQPVENKDLRTNTDSALYKGPGKENGVKGNETYSKQKRRVRIDTENKNNGKFRNIDVCDKTVDNYENIVYTHNKMTQEVNGILKRNEQVEDESSKIVAIVQCDDALEKISYECDLCGYVTHMKEMLVSHIIQHNSKNNYSENEGILQLETEVLTHNSKKPDRKNHCEKISARDLCSINSASQSNLNYNLLTNTDEKPFECNLCSYRSASESSLNDHLFTHPDKKSFVCDLCSFKSVRKVNLKRHLLTHTGEKPFACHLCSYKSAQKVHLSNHILTHTGEKPFTCKYCSFKSARKVNLNRHELTHTGTKPFACNLCPYRSSQKVHLKSHILRHIAQKPFECKFKDCKFKSDWKANLDRHVSRCHNVK